MKNQCCTGGVVKKIDKMDSGVETDCKFQSESYLFDIEKVSQSLAEYIARLGDRLSPVLTEINAGIPAPETIRKLSSNYLQTRLCDILNTLEGRLLEMDNLYNRISL